MITSKQRAKLKGIAMNIDTIFQIGKGGISDNLIKQVDDALEAREIIKLRVLENCMEHSCGKDKFRTCADYRKQDCTLQTQ